MLFRFRFFVFSILSTSTVAIHGNLRHLDGDECINSATGGSTDSGCNSTHPICIDERCAPCVNAYADDRADFGCNDPDKPICIKYDGSHPDVSFGGDRCVSAEFGLDEDDSCGVSRRRAWRDTSCADRTAYLEAVKALKELPASNVLNIPNFDLFSSIHSASWGIAHGTPRFLPWHRWFLYKYEKALQTVTGTCVTVPYWDWERDSGNEAASSVFEATTFGSTTGVNSDCSALVDDSIFGGFGCCVDEGVADVNDFWTTTGGGDHCLKRNFTPTTFSSEIDVSNIILQNNVFGSFRPIFEGTPHGAPHCFIAGHMCHPNSPDDPLFMLHHCNVDRLWAIYQDYWQMDTVGTIGTDEYNGDDIDTPMEFPGAGALSSFFFNGATTPTPRELFKSFGGISDVTYVNDSFGRNLVFTTKGLSVKYRTTNNPDWVELAKGPVRSIDCDRPQGPHQCTNCFGNSQGPCKAPHDGVCHQLNALGKCPPATHRCSPKTPRAGEPDFADATIGPRFKELTGAGMGSAQAVRTIAKERCDAKGNPIVASDDWIAMTGGNPEMFRCYVELST